jgi:hypothetical protein
MLHVGFALRDSELDPVRGPVAIVAVLWQCIRNDPFDLCEDSSVLLEVVPQPRNLGFTETYAGEVNAAEISVRSFPLLPKKDMGSLASLLAL